MSEGAVVLPQHEWRLVLAVKDGHRFFANQYLKIALADDSGRMPEECEDGILWLDRDKTIILYNDWALLPIVHDHGDQAHTAEPHVGALQIAKRFGMQIRAEEKIAELLWAAYDFGGPIEIPATIPRPKDFFRIVRA